MNLTARPRSDGALVGRVQGQRELAVLRHRELGCDIGCCERCGKPVRSQQNFTRKDGAIAHVRCRITDPLARPALNRGGCQ